MSRRALAVLVLGAGSLAAAVTTALAGGWAVTTVHPLGHAPVAGDATRVAFTVRQHGQRPVLLEDVAIEIISADGTTTRFPARPLTRRGRYAADVVFPREGRWRWQLLQGWFGPQPLGTVTVVGERRLPPVLDGRSLFLSKGCATCHVGPDTSSRIAAGPDLRGIGARLSGAAGLAYLRQSILAPAAVVVPGGGNGAAPRVMPTLEVSRAEAEALARYLARPR